MIIRRKQVEPLGFKGSDMYENAATHNHYYKKDPVKKTITVIGNLSPQTVSIFKLTDKQFAKFEKNKLGIVPPGCVSVSSRPMIETPDNVIEGDIKNKRHLMRILEVLEESVS